MKDGVKIHAMADFGISIQSQRLFAPIRNIPCSSTQAEIRRNMLRWRLKKRIALRNSILFWVVFIPTAIVELIGIFFLFFVTLNSISVFLGYSLGAFSGIICAMVIIIAWLFTYDKLDSHFETDPYYIKR